MAFTLALYYPYIEIENESWLKNAVLYWDKISTIVPDSINKPYKTRTAKELYDAGALIPLRVKSSMEEIKLLTIDVGKFLSSPEAGELLYTRGLSSRNSVDNDLTSNPLRMSSLHLEKLSDEVKHMIKNSGMLSQQRGSWYEVDPKFAEFYMTLLARKLSERVGAGLLTDVPESNNLAIAAKLDASRTDWKRVFRRQEEYRAFGPRRMAPRELAQGVLADLIIEKIKIDPDTPVRDILKFREDHADELGRFRKNIADLTKQASSNFPIEHLQQTINDTYANEVLPSINDLKSSLKASKIEWVTETALKVAFLSVSSNSLFTNIGLSVPQALLAGAGVSLTVSKIIYNLRRERAIHDNPYAYIFSAEQQLG